MILVIDFDSTIVDTSRAIHNIYKQETGDINSKYNPKHGWDFSGLVPKEYVPRCYELFTDKKLTNNLKPFDNAIEVLTRLSEKHEIWVCTNQHPLRIPYTEEWIKKNLPFVKMCYVRSFNKGVCAGDVFIDDRGDCLESVLGNFKYRICYGRYSWNKDWTGIRKTNWMDIEKFVSGL